jgi:hypothetical protein
LPHVHQPEPNTVALGTAGGTLLQLPPLILIGPFGLLAVDGTVDTTTGVKLGCL